VEEFAYLLGFQNYPICVVGKENIT